MATVVFINRLQPADGKRDALIGLLREFADSINADPECLHYSVHEPIDDKATPLTVIDATPGTMFPRGAASLSARTQERAAHSRGPQTAL